MMDTHDRTMRSMDELMHADVLTPEELATLFDMPINVVRNAAYDGHLKATILDHGIISITRGDALQWMNQRDKED